MNRLQGKTAVITGGNSGVGAAAALLFAREGANVVISARRQSALDEVAEKIRAEGGSVLTVATDISKDGDCKALMQAAADKFGKIDILVNNAGVLDTGLKAIDKYLDEDAEKVISINEVGTMQCIRAALEKMSEGAAYLLGHHDFTSFRAVKCQAKSPLKTLDRLDIRQEGENIFFYTEARSFLHHQVRNMVGTLKMVGDGHLAPEEIKTILEARDRRAAGPTAPACGLYLSKIMYRA